MNNPYSQASAILNQVAPEGERLAYLNPYEEALLKQIGGSGHEHIAGIPSYNIFQDGWDLLRGKKARKAQEAAVNAQKKAVADNEAKQEQKMADANNQGWAADLISRGKLAYTDLSDPGKVRDALSSLEGQFIDPFPEYARETGDLILEDLEGASGSAEAFIGDSVSRMEDFSDTYNRLDLMQDSALDTAEDIFDPSGMESRMKTYNNELTGLLGDLKELNTQTAALDRGLMDDVLSSNTNLGNSLGDSVTERADLANQEFDALRSASDSRLAGEIARAAAERRNASSQSAGGMRALNSMGGNASTGNRMAQAMLNSERGAQQSEGLANALIAESDRRGGIEADRFSKLGEINPALAQVYRDEMEATNAATNLEFGTPGLDAQATNLGIDQSILDNSQQMENTIRNARLKNLGLIPALGQQSALLPALFGEAAFGATQPFKREVNPYTSAGELASGQTRFNESPFVPEPIPTSGGGIDWFKVLRNAPEIINKVQNIGNNGGA